MGILGAAMAGAAEGAGAGIYKAADRWNERIGEAEKQEAMAARETNLAMLNNSASMERLNVSEAGSDRRLGVSEAGADRRLGVTEAGARARQNAGFIHNENLAEARQKFDTEQHALNRTLTREQIASHEKVAAANNKIAVEIAKLGGSATTDKDGNVLWIDKEGKSKQVIGPDGKALKAHADLTPAAKAFADVLKAQLVDLDRMEIQAQGDQTQIANIKQRRAEYTGQLLNVLTGGISAVPKDQPGIVAPQGAIDALKKDPKLADQFDAKYGKGAAQKHLTAPAAGNGTSSAPDPLEEGDRNPQGFDKAPLVPEKKSRGLIERERVLKRKEERDKEDYEKKFLGNAL